MKWVTAESCSYFPPTYWICLYHRNSYHLIFMVFKKPNLILGICPIKSHTVGTVRAWAALLPCHNTGWMSLEHAAGWKWVQVEGKKQTQTIHCFLGWKIIRKSGVTTVWSRLCSCPRWIPVPPHMTVQVQRCRQSMCLSQPAPALRELHDSHVVCPHVH